MLTKTFEYVSEFDMNTALFDRHRSFYNQYRREYLLDTQVKNPRMALSGRMRHMSNEMYQSEYPVVHLPTGELIIMANVIKAEHRGRYTFGGYDFSVITTSSDWYGQMLMKHIIVPDHGLLPAYKPKGDGASLNQTAGHSIEGQWLIVDHVTNRVWSLHAESETADQDATLEGVKPSTHRREIPERFVNYNWRVYARAPGLGFTARRSIRLTTPRSKRNLPDGYEDIVAQCVAWYHMQGMDMHGIYRTTTHPRDRSVGMRLQVLVDPQYAVNQGFENLTPIERGNIATVNASPSKKLPRLVYRYYQLQFDSEALFKSWATQTA